MREDVKHTLDLLQLWRKHYCVVVQNTPAMKGMLVKAKDYVTFGEIDEDTIKLLNEKRLEKTNTPDPRKS